METKTAIAVFCYKRAAKLRSSMEALLCNPECAFMDVIFFCDGPKGEQDRSGVEETRSYIDALSGFGKIVRQYRKKNVSTGPNFTEGLQWLCRHYHQFVVVEDDLVVAPNYIRYMLDGLDHYREQRSVFCVTGFNFPLKVSSYNYDTLICNRFCSYGWASWSDRVRLVIFDKQGLKDLINSSPGLRQRLNEEGKDLHRMLIKQIDGRISTWDIQMQVHVSENRLKVVYPVLSKASNIGFGEGSTNTFGIDYLKTAVDPGDRRSFAFCDAGARNEGLQRQVRRPYRLRALVARKLINTCIKLSLPLKRFL